MNLKYFLRGLGLGIIVTALIMGFTMNGKKQELTNEEIITRAKALGMIENKVLSQYEDDYMEAVEKADQYYLSKIKDITVQGSELLIDADQNQIDQVPEQTESEAQGDPGAEETKTDTADTGTGQNAADGADTGTGQNTADGADTGTKENVTDAAGAAEVPPRSETVPFEVRQGDGSHTVSNRLAEAGIIASSAEFDQYLIKNGYDKKIVAAQYEIPAGADFETIAKVISGR